MNNRVLDISETPARLSVDNGLLCVDVPNAGRRTFPFSTLAAIVCCHPQITFTLGVLAELAASRTMLVVSDRKRMPAAMLLPLASHHAQTAKFRLQAEASLPLRKRLWKEIVQSKIRAQAGLIRALHGVDPALERLVRAITVSNAAAVEAQASRIYWGRLFGDGTYRRSDEEDPRNALLDYGYAVVRAACARALCGAGLHPGLPLHHHNTYDPFPLANDLMEPLRPIVDAWVVRRVRISQEGLTRESKQALLAWLTGRFSDGAESRTLFDWAHIVAERLARCLEGSLRRLDFPLLEPADDETTERGDPQDPQ